MQTSTDLTATKLYSRNSEGLFQQDGARAHTSKATIAWLDTNIRHYIPPDDWPPNLPDLSPIENVWSIMATTIYADPEPQSPQALKQRLRKAWTSISPSTLNILSVLCLTDWKQSLTRLWANAQPDGRPAKHRWHPLFNAAKFGWRPLLDDVQ